MESASINVAALGLVEWLLLIVALIWVVAAGYEGLLRRRHNLTRAERAGANPDLELDFLKKDDDVRQKALEAADTYARELETGEQSAPVKASRLRQLFSVLTAIMAVITLIGVIGSTIARLEHTGDLVREVGLNQLTAVIEQYPVGTYLSVLIIIYHIVAFFVFQKWRGSAR